MATVTGLTAPRMLEIEANSVVNGTVDENGHLKLTTHGGEVIDAGKVKGDKGEPGGVGPAGPASSPNPEPIAPTALAVMSNSAVYSPAEQPVSTVIFSWNPVLLNIIGDVPAIDAYELWYRSGAGASVLLTPTANVTTVSVTTLEPGVPVMVKVRAHTFQGAWGAFSTEIPVTPAVPSSSVPKVPADVTVLTNVGKYLPDGRAVAEINIRWDAVTESLENDPIGIRAYELSIILDGVNSTLFSTSDTNVFVSLPSGLTPTFRVRAVSNFGLWSAYSSGDTVTTAFPAQNNNPATVPVLTTNMGVVYSSWNGNLSTGAAGPEFQHLITEIASTPGGPWTAIGIPAVSAGQTAVVPSTPGANVSVRFRWRDKLGRLSTGISPVASITVLGIEQADFTPDLSDVITNLEAAVVSVVTEYAVNDSETVPPVSGWSTATPARTPGTFVWMRTTTNYADDTSTTSSPVLVTGNTGASGGTGAPGKGISSTAVTYQVHSNGTTAPTGTWVASPPATSPGQFLWTRTITTYTDATTTTAYSVAAHGATGAPGVGVSSTAVTYQVHSSGTVAPTGTWLASPAATSPGQFLWTRTVTTYTDASTSTAYSVAAHGATGATGAPGSQGIQGPPGANGQPTYTWIKYADTPTTGMSDSPTGKVYMGIAYNKSTATESSTYSDYEWSLIKGADGEDGKGISSTVVTYQVHSNGTTAPTGTWVSSPPATSPGQFLWTRTVTTYTDASSSTAYSVAAHGATGSTGAAGKGISSTAVTYQVHSNGTTAPTGTWQASPQATTPGQFLWTRTITTYTDATTTTAYAVAAHGAQGSQGIQGPPGANGQPTYTWIKYGTSAAGAGMSDDPTGKTYMGIAYNKTTATESSNPADYEWSLIQGPQGNTGAAGKGISTTVVTYQVHSNGTTAPTGTWVSSPPATSPGQFLWTRTVLTYTDATTSTVYSVAAHGATGAAGTDATTVAVGNDAVAIPTNPSGTTTASHVVTIPFSGWIGNARAAATVVVSGLPSGITVGTNTAATTGADGTLTLNVANGSTIGGGTNGEITLTITCNGKTFVRKFSWTKAPQGATGSTGSTGSPGAAATSIDVGNEAAVIPCTAAGATVGASTITIPFTGFIGSARAAATVVVSGLPTGITVQTNTAGTTGAAGSLVLAVASASTLGGATSGNITLTITCNSITFVQTFSWSKAIAGAAGSTGGTGPAGKGVSSVTPYYLQQGTGVTPPAAPTTNPPGGSWSITEPGYVSSTELYRAELFVFTDATFGWTTVSKVSAYTAATQAMTAANLADAAAHGMVKASQTDPGQSAGRIWLVLNASNQVIGVKISNGSAWTSYILMADQILVPSSVGTVSIADGAVVTPKLDAVEIWGNEAWLEVLRVGVIEASMVTSEFASELTLESNHAINAIITTQTEFSDSLSTVQDDLETTSETLVELSDDLGTVAGLADTAKTAAEAADALAKQNQTALTQTQTWFRVDAQGAHVGRSDSAFQTHILADKFSITDNGIETSWWEAGRMVVPVMEATKQIVIARHQLEPFPSVNPTGTVIRSVS